jgi:hypothetical protein
MKDFFVLTLFIFYNYFSFKLKSILTRFYLLLNVSSYSISSFINSLAQIKALSKHDDSVMNRRKASIQKKIYNHLT